MILFLLITLQGAVNEYDNLPVLQSPGLQSHRNEPGSFTQSVLDEQLLAPYPSHLSTSAMVHLALDSYSPSLHIKDLIMSNQKKKNGRK